MASPWTLLGCVSNTDLRKENLTTNTLDLPASVSIFKADGVTPEVLSGDRNGNTTVANPLPTGVPVGTPGVDVVGNLYCYAPVGTKVLIIDGVTYGPLVFHPDPDDLAALLVWA
jgi:hypothetical protein